MQPSIDLQLVGTLSTAATRCGADLNGALSALRVEVARDRKPFQQLPISFIAELFERLDRSATRGHFPFALAESFNFDGQPAISAFLTSAESLRAATRMLDWVPALIHPAFHIVGLDDGIEAPLILRVDDPHGPHDGSPVLIEMIAAVVARVCRLIAPDAQAIRAIQFRHAARTAPEMYADYLGCPVRFEAEDSRIHFDRRWLDPRLPGSLPQAHLRAEELLRVGMLGDDIAPPASVLVEEALRARPELVGEGLDALAHALRLHPRSLQRRLKDEGRPYSELLARARHRLACELLRSRDLDMETIAAKLGYSERRSFTQAFRQWQGQSPSEYRQRMRSGA